MKYLTLLLPLILCGCPDSTPKTPTAMSQTKFTEIRNEYGSTDGRIFTVTVEGQKFVVVQMSSGVAMSPLKTDLTVEAK